MLLQRTIFCRPHFRGCQIVSACSRQHSTPAESSLSAFVSAAERIQHAKNYYELFPQTLAAGPPPEGSFGLQASPLRREYLKLMQLVHPDVVADAYKAQAEGLTARVSEAHRTLLHPLLRARYLLQLRGIDLANDEAGRITDPELLELIVDLRSDIEDVQSEADLLPLTKANDDRIQASIAVLEKAFAHDDLDTAAAEAVRLRYFDNIRQSIESWQPGRPVQLVH